MGKSALNGPEEARRVLEGALLAVDASPGVALAGWFNITLTGAFVATLRLEQSFDGGANYSPLTYIDGTALSWSGPISTPYEAIEAGVLYRIGCTAYTSGTVNYRLSA